MSEKVTDGVNGLHFRRSDAEDLAATMLRAAEEPGLWEKLHSGVPARPPRTMAEHVEALSAIYNRLWAAPSAQKPEETVLEGAGSA